MKVTCRIFLRSVDSLKPSEDPSPGSSPSNSGLGHRHHSLSQCQPMGSLRLQDSGKQVLLPEGHPMASCQGMGQAFLANPSLWGSKS